MDATDLIVKMRAQRAHWVTLPNGRRLQYLRPPEVELPQLAGGVRLEHVVAYACGWDGFTEADLLDPTIASSDAAPFHTDLWAEYVRDNAACVGVVADHMVETVANYLEKRAATAKNSPPSST